MRIFSGRVPHCAATSFFRSPIVSSSLCEDKAIQGRRRGARGVRLLYFKGFFFSGGCLILGIIYFCVSRQTGCVCCYGGTHLHLTRIFFPCERVKRARWGEGY
jgi:hypothetical protein